MNKHVKKKTIKMKPRKVNIYVKKVKCNKLPVRDVLEKIHYV